MKAIDAARVLCRAADFEAAEGEDRLTHMRVQKLLYYCQGWSLADRDRPLFDDAIEAWVHGPVVRSVYSRLSKFGSNTIDPADLGDYEDEIDPDDVVFIERVWKTYKDHSTTSLREMTHSEPPWKEARKGLPVEAISDRKISPDSMRRFFLALEGAAS